MNEFEEAAGLAPTSNYQYAQKVGHQLFIAGQVPHDAAGRIVGRDDPQAQAVQCLENLKTLIVHHGFRQRDIRQLVVYVVGDQQALRSAWNAVEHWFANEVPPATLLGVALLGYEEQLVEIDATIVKGFS